MTELPDLDNPDVRQGWLCVQLYLHGRSDCQWQTHYVAVHGGWEWYFW